LSSSDKHIIFFDGYCNLCDNFINKIIKADKKNIFYFAPLQSIVAQELLAQQNFYTTQLKTVVYYKQGQLYFKSSAALNIFKTLGGFYFIAYCLGIIWPLFIRNFVYDIISRNRYKWFGKKESCLVPNDAIKAKFLI
jgi:predicted DCC family thiol-disulfide oxidoreductase YuxK